MLFSSLQEVFEAFRGIRVLILGDVMVDSYIRGSVGRISPEAPVPVVHVKHKENRLGGAANVAMNIQALGAEPILCSIVGDDLEAENFQRLLEELGMSSRGIVKSAKRKTTIKHRVISGSHHLLRIDEEVDQPLDDLDRKALQAHIRNLMKDCHVVIFEDYDKGCLDADLISYTIREAHALGIPTTVDPKRRNFMYYEGATLFKPNLHELVEGLQQPVDPGKIQDLNKAVRQLKNQMPIDKALITLSQHGVFFMDGDDSGHIPAHLRSISDVSGAGDTVISIASLGLALGMSLEFTAELANLGGGIVCEYPGVVPIDLARLIEESSSNARLAAHFSS